MVRPRVQQASSTSRIAVLHQCIRPLIGACCALGHRGYQRASPAHEFAHSHHVRTAGFFAPRAPAHWLFGGKVTSWHDTGGLKSTLERLVDFDRINARETRFSIAAVNVRTGNFAYFDNAATMIRAEHVMARRRAAAKISYRWRALLGSRADLDHGAAIRRSICTASQDCCHVVHAELASPSMCRHLVSWLAQFE